MIKRIWCVAFCLLFTVVTVSCQGSGGKTTTTSSIPSNMIAQTMNLLNGSIIIQPGKWNQVQFDVAKNNMHNVVITGWVHASGGSKNDVEIFIVSDTDYDSWTQGRQVNPVYNSGRTTLANINVNMPAVTNTYHLVLSNIFSSSMKTVQAEIYLKYYVQITPTTTTSAVSSNTTAPSTK